jgi:GAF domain-containing protein
VAGHVYRTGRARLSGAAEEDDTFDKRMDRGTGYRTHSIIGAPIRIGEAVCGTIELLNRSSGDPYDDRDLDLLEIFASYTASSIQNALEARNAQALARMDDLTGLYNDRYLHALVDHTRDLRGDLLHDVRIDADLASAEYLTRELQQHPPALGLVVARPQR